MTFPDVRIISDGEDAEAATFNRALQDLTARTDFLRGALQNISAQRTVEISDAPLGVGVLPGMPVYLDSASGQFRPALAALDAASDYNYADDRALWRGIVSEAAGAVGTVVLQGVVSLTPAQWDAVALSGLAQSGRYFLSSTVEGKLANDPGTLGIYIGDLSDNRLYLAAQAATNILQHIHLNVDLVGDPAGTIDPPTGSEHTFVSPDPDERGWLPATSTYFPQADIPVGAAFGYNTQHPSESRLRSLFPPVPISTAQFELRGLSLGSSRIIANQSGIWWMSAAYGEVPWDDDWANNQISDEVRYWTVRVPAATTLVEILYNQVFNQLSDELDQLAVTSVTSEQADSFIAVTPPAGKGDITLFNDGVHRIRQGGGMRVTGTAGDLQAGRRHSVRVEDGVEHELRPVATGGPSFDATITGDGTTTTFEVTHNLGTQSAALVNEFIEEIEGDGLATTFSITHGLNAPYPSVVVWDTLALEWVVPSIVSTSPNSIEVGFAVAPAASEKFAVVVQAGAGGGAAGQIPPPIVRATDDQGDQFAIDDLTVISTNTVAIQFAAAPADQQEISVVVTSRPSAPDIVPITTFDVPGSQAMIDLAGVRVSSGRAASFLFHLGDQLNLNESYQPRIRLLFAIDTPHQAEATVGEFDVLVTRVSDQGLVSETNQFMAMRAGEVGRPGRLQVAQVLAPASFRVSRGQSLLVRVLERTTGAPVPSDSLRMVGVYASFWLG